MTKFLLVNSVKFFHERNKTLLNREGFVILTAMAGTEALEIHRKERVNIIMADLDMPDMTGENFCSHIRKDPDIKDVSIILVCKDSAAEIERVKKSGANGWLTIPIHSDRFLDLVGRFLAIPVRQAYRVLLKVTVHTEKGEETILCTSKNISATGMLIETSKVQAVGDRITCSFFLTNSCPVVADAEIVRSVDCGTSFQYGIRFVRLDSAATKAIEAFIADRRPHR